MLGSSSQSVEVCLKKNNTIPYAHSSMWKTTIRSFSWGFPMGFPPCSSIFPHLFRVENPRLSWSTPLRASGTMLVACRRPRSHAWRENPSVEPRKPPRSTRPIWKPRGLYQHEMQGKKHKQTSIYTLWMSIVYIKTGVDEVHHSTSMPQWAQIWNYEDLFRRKTNKYINPSR